jgi:lipopolysaccharide export system protein LptA
MRNACSVLLAATLLLPGGAAVAERADRGKPLTVEADQPGRIDLANQFVVFNGNVVITKGTMVIRAAKVEVRETADGYHSAVATGAAGKPASFRQKRDVVEEYVEGEADKLEYDGRADSIRFVGNAAVRRLRGTAVADELSGSQVTWDNTSEVFSVAGGAVTPENPSGRVRAVLTPRPGSAAASAAAVEPPPALRSTPALGASRP